MRHYYVTGPEQVQMVEEPRPEPGPGQVLVKVAYTALSPGSNLYLYRTGGYGGTSGKREEAVYMGSGVIEAAGEGVTRCVAGDRVAMVGVGHQEAAVLAEGQVHRIPDGLHSRDASLAYLSAWSVSALHLGQYAAAETVVVVGLGLVGLSAAGMADQMGARLLGLDVDAHRVEFARRMGLGAVEMPGAPGAQERMSAFLGETGADLILETSGSWLGFKQALALARDWTRIAVMGIYRQPPPADLALELHGLLYGFPSKFHYQRLQIIGCGSDPAEVVAPSPRLATTHRNFAYALEQAARGKLPLGKLVSHVAKPEEIASVMRIMLAGDRSYVGVVFDWNAV
jgi:threonine dehydrogenase-like Zn-dependent dehydrogenase